MGSAGDVGAAVYLNNKGYRRIAGYDNNGNPLYRHLNVNELMRPEFRDQATRLAEDSANRREEQLRERDALIRAEERQRWRSSFGLQQEELALRGQQNANSYQLGVLGIQAGERNSERNFQHLGAVLADNREERRMARALELERLKKSDDQFTRTLAYKTESESEDRELTRKQIEENTLLARERMAYEKDQFNRQLAQDERSSRRARVINSLSIVAQSLARL